MTILQYLRIRLVLKISGDISRWQAASPFEVSASSAIRFMHQYEAQGSVANEQEGLDVQAGSDNLA